MERQPFNRFLLALRWQKAAFLCLALFFLFSSHAFSQYVGCDGFGDNFESQPGLWSITDNAGNGVIWGSLQNCAGATSNETGGSGDALCASKSSGASGQPYDTTAVSNVFNLKGATSAFLDYDVRANLSAVGTDMLIVDIGVGNPPTWTQVKSYLGSVSAKHETIDLSGFLGNDTVQVRFRFVDVGQLLPFSSYAQIDNVVINCTGGVDLSVTAVPDRNSALVGDPVNYTVTVKNNSSSPSTDLMLTFSLPSGYQFFEAIPSVPGILDYHLGMFVFSPSAPLSGGDSFSVSVSGEAGMEPKATLSVISPSALAGSYEAGGALFGPSLSAIPPLTGELAIVQDSSGIYAFDDACESVVNGDAINGKIALIRDGFCDPDIKVKNVQDVGAIGAVLWNPPVSIPIYSYIAEQVRALRPLDPVTLNISIPAVVVGNSLGTQIKNALGTGSVSVTVSDRKEASQDQSAMGVVKGSEMDPTLNLLALLTQGGIATSVNNFSTPSVVTMLDSDGDGVADINDGCQNDPAKTVPGICGCGKADVDANSNGVIDCLYGNELKAMLEAARINLKGLKRIKLTGKPKKDKKKKLAQKSTKVAIKALVNQIFTFASLNTAFISLNDEAVDLMKLIRRVRRKTKRALKTASPSFGRNKRKAMRAIKKAQKVLL